MVRYREEMDYFKNHSYWYIRLMLFYSGLWPYASRRIQCITSTVQIFVLTTTTFSSLFKFITLFPRIESVAYTLGFLLICLLSFLTYLIYMYKRSQLKILWKFIESDWKKLEKMNKISIAKRYAGKSNLISLYVIIIVSIYYVLVCLDTFLPYILDAVSTKKLNGLKLPISVELFGKYNLSLTLVLIFFSMLVKMLVAIMIAEFIIFVNHACLLFSLTGDLLEHGFTNIVKDNNADNDEILYKTMVESIKYHTAAIGFSKMIEDTYTFICFYVMLIVIAMLTSNCLRLFHMILSRNVFSTIVSFLFLFCIVGIAFVVTHIGQLLIDHSLDVFYKASSVPWYIVSFKSQKLLLIILARSIKPSYLTHGKMAILSHTLFTMMLHSAISVTTVFISMR